MGPHRNGVGFWHGSSLPRNSSPSVKSKCDKFMNPKTFYVIGGFSRHPWRPRYVSVVRRISLNIKSVFGDTLQRCAAHFLIAS